MRAFWTIGGLLLILLLLFVGGRVAVEVALIMLEIILEILSNL